MFTDNIHSFCKNDLKGLKELVGMSAGQDIKSVNFFVGKPVLKYVSG